jgi:aminoglycoside 3-N-acetyltransferase
MNEKEAINNIKKPNTRESIAQELRKLGLKKGMIVLVHSSLSALGWVCGGPVAVVQALMDVITEEGTLVMPTHSGDYSEPSYWGNPPVPKEWWQTIRDTMPAYEPEITPTRGMGSIVESFRNWQGVIRSSNPQVSFAAWGKYDKEITNNHSLHYGLGEESPIAKIYDLDGYVLLLGVGYGNNTSFHLAEYRADGAEKYENGAPIIEDGKRVWKIINDIELDDEIFPNIGQDYDKTGKVLVGNVGLAQVRLFKQKPSVDYAERWIGDYRKKGK